MAEAKKLLRILFVSDDFSPAITGVGVHIQTLAREFVLQGHSVAIITSNPKKTTGEYGLINGVTIFRAPTLIAAGFPQALPSTKFIDNIIREFRPDIIHHHYFSFLLLRVLKSEANRNIPAVYTYHFSPAVLARPWFMRPFKPVIYGLLRRIYEKMDLVIVPSKHAELQFDQRKFKGQIKHITNPVFFNSPSLVMDRENGKNHILYAGRLAIEKNISLLIKACKILKTRNIPFHLNIAGEGPLRQELVDQVHNLDLEDCISFLGHIDHEKLSREYLQASTFVLPSKIETLSLVAIEAMTFGCALIVTKEILCANELVEHGRNGFIVDPDHEEDLAKRLEEIILNPTLGKLLGQEGRELAKRFNAASVAQETLSSYYELLR